MARCHTPKVTVLKLLEPDFVNGRRAKARVQVLEVFDRKARDKTGRPVAVLIVEREEAYRRDEANGPIVEASIRLAYRRVPELGDCHLDARGTFDAGYRMTPEKPRVSLTSSNSTTVACGGHGAVFVNPDDLCGLRVGTYLMNEVVIWARQWPDAEVNAIKLQADMASTSNKDRRNRFYEQFNIQFDYVEIGRESGLSRPMLASELTPVDAWKQNINEIEVLPYIGRLIDDELAATSELQFRDRAVGDLHAELRMAKSRPVRWALGQLFSRHGERLAVWAVVVVFGLLTWFAV